MSTKVSIRKIAIFLVDAAGTWIGGLILAVLILAALMFVIEPWLLSLPGVGLN